ncbi:MAG: 50S ribosomal protein L31 [Myxococcales bacterium]|nr:50S ribosomal protein L31 [Myxococcales bacterium]|tara:strand:- start:261 stop:503 length:243 start_codon:yes stop_codon:yes gene_type:complete
MKAGIHPEYKEVIFYDVAADYKLLTRSTRTSKDTIEYEGKEYPCIKIDISSKSHPFFTGTQRLLDTEGRVERFRRKYAKN